MNAETNTPMKITKYLALALLALGLGPVFGQTIVVGYDGQKYIVAQVTNFTRFNLDFPGGTPKQLVEELDAAEAEQHETVQVIPLHRTSADAVERALTAFGGDAVQDAQTNALGNNGNNDRNSSPFGAGRGFGRGSGGANGGQPSMGGRPFGGFNGGGRGGGFGGGRGGRGGG